MGNILEHLRNVGIYDRLFDSILAFVFFIFLRWTLIKILLRLPHDKQKEFIWRKTATYCSVFVLIFLLAFVWLRAFHSMGTFFGFLSAGLAVALKDPLMNIAGWLFIIVRKPFQIGDRIQIGNYAGDVVDVDVFQITLMESSTSGVSKDLLTGRRVKISNSAVFTEPQVNFTRGWFEYVRNAIEVCITSESNWKKAMAILKEIVTAESEDASGRAKKAMRESSEKYMVFDIALEPLVFVEIDSKGVVLTAVYLCDPRFRRISSGKVWEQLLERFSVEEDITFAYPNQRIFSNVTGEKPAVGAGVAGTVESRDGTESLRQQPDTSLFKNKSH
jgi:small-conductance mechanosensitive channel